MARLQKMAKFGKKDRGKGKAGTSTTAPNRGTAPPDTPTTIVISLPPPPPIRSSDRPGTR